MRGIACILLVAFHVVGFETTGLKIEHGWYRNFNDLLAFVRMPLFTFLSGVVYAYRPFSTGVGRFLIGKIKRLLFPLLTVGTSFAILQANISGVNAPPINWRLLHILPVAHFWFIESIFLIFLILIPIELFCLFKSKIGFFAVFLVSLCLYLLDIHFKYFGVSGALYLFPFFLLGMGLQRFSIIEFLGLKTGFLLIMGMIFILVMQYFKITEITKQSFMGFVLGAMCCVGLLAIKFESVLLAKIGVFSYTIYLYHVFFTAGARIILNKLGVYDINILFLSSLSAAIVGSIIVELIFNGSNFTRLAFLGKSKVDSSELWLTKYFNQRLNLK